MPKFRVGLYKKYSKFKIYHISIDFWVPNIFMFKNACSKYCKLNEYFFAEKLKICSIDNYHFCSQNHRWFLQNLDDIDTGPDDNLWTIHIHCYRDTHAPIPSLKIKLKNSVFQNWKIQFFKMFTKINQLCSDVLHDIGSSSIFRFKNAAIILQVEWIFSTERIRTI